MHVLLYGATGFTGTLVARALRARGLPLALSGRDRLRLSTLAAELGGVEIRPAPVHDRAGLVAAFQGASCVVNCAGPFSVIGEPVVRAAIEAGVHYLDTTGEQTYMRAIHEGCESAARHAGVAVVPSLAFEVALGDWAARLAAQRLGDRALDEVIIAYAVDRFAPRRGTRRSALESLGAPGCVWHVDRWEPVAPAAEVREVVFPPPFGSRRTVSFPSGEVITVPRHVDAARVQTYLSYRADSRRSRLEARLTSLVGPALPALLATPLAAAVTARLADGADAPTDDPRPASRFAILAVARRRFEEARIAIRGADPCGLTAEIVALGAAHLHARGRAPGPAGVLAPAELLSPEPALAQLAARCQLSVDS